MSMTYLTLLRTLTPLHVGTGQSVGAIDLPVARERATSWPIVPGSSLKGVLRDAAMRAFVEQHGLSDDDEGQERAEGHVAPLFGRGGDEQAHAGAFAFSDMRLICMPVRSYAGTFAYVTCELAVQRLSELLNLAGAEDVQSKPFEVTDPHKCKCLGNAAVRFRSNQVILEDLDLNADMLEPEPSAAFAKAISVGLGVHPDEIAKRLVCVESSMFTYLVNFATELVTHVTLDFATKSAKKGYLRQEEAVPTEAIFAGIATAQFGPISKREDATKLFEALLNRNILQFGGKATSGMGLCRFAAFGGGQ